MSNKTRLSTLATFIIHSSRNPRHGNQRVNKGIQSAKEVELSLCADGMIIYIENLKDTTRNLLELLNESGKVAAYKI